MSFKIPPGQNTYQPKNEFQKVVEQVRDIVDSKSNIGMYTLSGGSGNPYEIIIFCNWDKEDYQPGVDEPLITLTEGWNNDGEMVGVKDDGKLATFIIHDTLHDDPKDKKPEKIQDLNIRTELYQKVASTLHDKWNF